MEQVASKKKDNHGLKILIFSFAIMLTFFTIWIMVEEYFELNVPVFMLGGQDE